jgi:hypothetical protein
MKKDCTAYWLRISITIRYYHRSRLHLSLDRDSPDPRPVQSVGKIIAFPEVGGTVGANGVFRMDNQTPIAP